MSNVTRVFGLAMMLSLLSGCTVLAVADFAVSTAVTVGTAAVKTTGAVVGVAADGVKAMTHKSEAKPAAKPETAPEVKPEVKPEVAATVTPEATPVATTAPLVEAPPLVAQPVEQ